MRFLRFILVAAPLLGSHLTFAQPTFGLQYATELQTDFKGGFNMPGLLRLEAEVPVGNSVSFQAASISIGKTRNERLINDFQVFSNIEEENLPFGLAVMNVVYRPGNRHEFYVGVRNINEDYFTSPITSLFTNSSCGVFPTISTNYDIANYPLASVGIHYAYCSDNLQILSSIYNGSGYSSPWGKEHVFQFNPARDGLFVMGQIGYESTQASFYMGGCLHTRTETLSRAETLSHAETLSRAETLWGYTECSLTQDLSLIAGCSHAFGSQVSCSDFLGIGFLYAIPKAGLGLYTDYARMDEGYECATELTCRIHVSEHLDLQPTIHWINQKEMKALVSLLRLSLVL
ncbi:MAG: hypothetical protein MJY79_05780 [Bacteroidaceae bacterium]|nr:hypothetical protein [Bacteroidaceae bacterium]